MEQNPCRLYLIGGAMGVGKTTVCQCLKRQLRNAVFLDGDWCWDASPFQVTDETKAVVLDNICHLLNNFIHCAAYENVIFCWVMHEQSILDEILSAVDTEACSVTAISLLASEETLTGRLLRDVDAGLRTPDVLERSLARLPLYPGLNTVKISTDGKPAEAIAAEIAALGSCERA